MKLSKNELEIDSELASLLFGILKEEGWGNGFEKQLALKFSIKECRDAWFQLILDWSQKFFYMGKGTVPLVYIVGRHYSKNEAISIYRKPK